MEISRPTYVDTLVDTRVAMEISIEFCELILKNVI